MDLTCFEVEPGRVTLEPSDHRRQWMTDTPNGYAYRCVPLSVANAHGWNMLCPGAFSATWNGGMGTDAIEIHADEPLPQGFVESHFGSGVLTFNPLLVITTEPGVELWISGPPNDAKDGIAPLSAVVETDWMPYSFSMNWRFTRKDHPVRFAKGEPFCFFFPMRRGLVEAARPRLRALEEEPALAKQYFAARANRNAAGMTAIQAKDRYQGWYAKAELPKGGDAVVEGHRAKSKPEPFTR